MLPERGMERLREGTWLREVGVGGGHVSVASRLITLADMSY